MRLPVIHGLIRRRLLINFRVDADVATRLLPAPFRPKLHEGYAIAGICLIRLEQIRPSWLPTILGSSSENAAHRFGVLWDEPSGETKEGVYIPRRDTGSWLNHVAGGRIFPGEHHWAKFQVEDDGTKINMKIKARNGGMSVDLRARQAISLPPSSCFQSLAESSAYFEGGSIGYSATSNCCRLDGLELHAHHWQVSPLDVEHVESSYFSDQKRFPAGSIHFDHALLMRDISHEWHPVPEMIAGPQDSLSA
jgi:hypothetical protein